MCLLTTYKCGVRPCSLFIGLIKSKSRLLVPECSGSHCNITQNVYMLIVHSMDKYEYIFIPQ